MIIHETATEYMLSSLADFICLSSQVVLDLSDLHPAVVVGHLRGESSGDQEAFLIYRNQETLPLNL